MSRFWIDTEQQRTDQGIQSSDGLAEHQASGYNRSEATCFRVAAPASTSTRVNAKSSLAMALVGWPPPDRFHPSSTSTHRRLWLWQPSNQYPPARVL